VAELVYRLNRTPKSLLALALLLAAAPVATAAGIGFRNDLKTPIFVQGESLVDGMIRKSQPVLIYPGRVGWDLRLPPGNRWITIADANVPGRILLRRQIIPFQGQDLRFLVRPFPGGLIRLVPAPGKGGP
jgi:hypothetical protein